MIAAIVGPSGAGKDLLIAGALAARPDLRLARRVITRPSNAGAEDFDGVTPAGFARMRDQLAGPGPVLFNGSRAALPQAVAQLPGLRVVLVTAPAALLARRLAARGREAQADITARLARADRAMPAGIAHVTVVNDGTPDTGIARLLAALQPDRVAR